MNYDQDSLKQFGWDIQRLINRQDLTRERSFAMFSEILSGRQPDLQQGALLAALVAKGETPEEIAGAWEAIDQLDTVHTTAQWSFPQPLTENSGTGMDALKTFNVSSAAAIVAAACGARIGRHGARALTSFCGTVDILEAVGIDVECEVATVARSIEQVGIGIFNGMSAKVHPQALGRILSQIRFGSTLNIAASLANPCRPTHAVRGVYSEALLSKVAALMREIGYRRAMVVHGFDASNQKGMDEISILGDTAVCSFSETGREERFTIAPEDLGLRRAQYEEIAPTGNLKTEAVRFVQVLADHGHDACREFTCLNAAAVLQVAGIAKDLTQGVSLSREALANGSALGKLRQWVEIQAEDSSGTARLEKLLEASKLAST